ncbi:MAG TPA: SOS response-associated peptidase [Ktedonobacteraceae bacterium]|jgi:putative SOS response-associated peptidase YedK|nr:SOS response-associated peptidase [Ktedonobacteraceae bacterium]
MCGRFTLKIDVGAIAKKFGAEPTIHTAPRYNIAPTQNVVSVLRNGSNHLDELRWGLIPAWAKDESIGSKMINARAETLAEKPSFKRLLLSRRCLIVADGFYEWKQEHGYKTPMYITMKDGEPFAFAGLWDSWKNPDGETIRTCTIITTKPNEVVEPIHDRMPAIMRPDMYDAWLDTSVKDVDLLEHLLGPYPAQEMTARAVSRLVNDPRREGAELLA